MVGWVKVAQRDGGSSPTADCACGGLYSLEVNPATEDPPRHHVGSTHPTSVNNPGYDGFIFPGGAEEVPRSSRDQLYVHPVRQHVERRVLPRSLPRHSLNQRDRFQRQ